MSFSGITELLNLGAEDGRHAKYLVFPSTPAHHQ